MVTIIGNGMGEYSFSNIKVDFSKFDRILCDINFITESDKYKRDNIDIVLKLKYKQIKEYILNNFQKENILYVVTGSPIFFSAGTIIFSLLPKNKVKMINNTSSKDYLLSYLGISQNEVDFLSLHGRDRIDLTKFLINQYTFILCDDKSILRVKNALKYIDKKEIEVTIGYKLGYKDEIIEQLDISSHSYRAFDLTQPYVLLIKRLFTPKNEISEDKDFETQRGMITKKYKRNLSLQNLDLKPNQILWDIGAGSGSCAIEAYKRYKVKTVLFEKQPLRCDYITKNLKEHYVVDTLFLKGEAQDLFETIEENPQRIFVGGGGEEVIKRLPYLYNRLDKDGIILINAITLKNLTQMLNILNQAEIEYEIYSLSITTYKGKLDLVEPERQLFVIKIYKNLSLLGYNEI